MIEIKNLCKDYGDFKLDNITFSVPSGSVVGFVGENGAGKSTTIKLLLNMIHRDSGDISIFGENDLRNFDSLKENIGVVLDEVNFPAYVTVKNVDRLMSLTYKKWDSHLFFKYIDYLKLPCSKTFKEFSRGMKMKLAIAVALSHDAHLLILDEATSGLDPIVRDEILDLFYDFVEDESRSILISSHIVSDLEKICDYIAFIHHGKLVFCKEKDRLLEEYAILKCSNEKLADIPRELIKGCRIHSLGVEALVERANAPKGFILDKASLEDIMLLMSKNKSVNNQN